MESEQCHATPCRYPLTISQNQAPASGLAQEINIGGLQLSVLPVGVIGARWSPNGSPARTMATDGDPSGTMILAAPVLTALVAAPYVACIGETAARATTLILLFVSSRPVDYATPD